MTCRCQRRKRPELNSLSHPGDVGDGLAAWCEEDEGGKESVGMVDWETEKRANCVRVKALECASLRPAGSCMVYGFFEVIRCHIRVHCFRGHLPHRQCSGDWQEIAFTRPATRGNDRVQKFSADTNTSICA